MTVKEISAGDALRMRSAARLAAVQALYQIATTETEADKVIRDFLAGRTGGVALADDPDNETETQIRLIEIESSLFTALVREADANEENIDGIIAAALSSEWPMERLEAILRAILRAGVAELLGDAETPAKVVISEFVDVAHAFYEGPEPGMVNAVLDRVAQNLRGGELAAG